MLSCDHCVGVLQAADRGWEGSTLFLILASDGCHQQRLLKLWLYHLLVEVLEWRRVGHHRSEVETPASSLFV